MPPWLISPDPWVSPKGLLDWAPRLLIEVGGREFEVSNRQGWATDCYSNQILLDSRKTCKVFLMLSPSHSLPPSRWMSLASMILQIHSSFRSPRRPHSLTLLKYGTLSWPWPPLLAQRRALRQSQLRLRPEMPRRRRCPRVKSRALWSS
jgi:hypothetical protein